MSADREGTCPSGGLWYTCSAQSPTFLGCCTSDPCKDGGCPSSDLRPAGMGVAGGPDFPVNDSSFWPNVKCSTGSWWTCAAQTPSFQGCCGTDPCGGKGCPLNQLYPAAFSTVPPLLQTSFFLSATSTAVPATSTSSSSTTSSTSTSSINASPAGQTAVTPLPQPSISSSSSPPTAAIAGGVVGGVVFFVMLGIIICLLRRKGHQLSGDKQESNLGASSGRKSPNLGFGSPKWNRFKPGSMASAQSSPITPPPLYGHSPHQGAIDEVHELDTIYPFNPNSDGNPGLGVRSSGLQEADAQADTPNPFPVQREWSRRRMSELADSPTDTLQRNSRREI